MLDDTLERVNISLPRRVLHRLDARARTAGETRSGFIARMAVEGRETRMPDSFCPARHKELQAFFERGSKAGIQAAHAPKLARQLARLDQAQQLQDMNLPGWALHSCKAVLLDIGQCL